MVNIEVVYATPERQAVIELAVAEGATLEQAVRDSGILARFPEISEHEINLGVFGAVCPPDRVVHEGDRIEIYRPLLLDPKEARRRRASKDK